MGVAKASVAANITATTSGRGSSPRLCASAIATGVTITATALLDRSSVRICVRK